jgi:hypothetical protein
MIGKKRRRYFLQIGDRLIPGTPTGLWGVAVNAGRGILYVMKKDGSLDMVWQYRE